MSQTKKQPTIEISKQSNTIATKKIDLIIDASQYQNVKVHDGISWFHSIIAISLTVIGIFFGIIMCCLIILFV